MVIAGYFPGIITYFSLWYTKREQTMRITIFCTATFASGALVGILVSISISAFNATRTIYFKAYASCKMNGIAGLQSWRWLFLFPGLPVIPLGMTTYLALGNIPGTVQCESTYHSIRTENSFFIHIRVRQL